MYALRERGCGWVISVSAVGSLVEWAAPGQVVLVDQFIDRTKGVRQATFFGDGVVGHVPFGDPICNTLRGYLAQAAKTAGATAHDGGTYVAMEGPAFSTRAESNLYRSWGATVVGMTNLPEAKLAREAGMSYATLAMVTDFDCWHPDHDNVDVQQIIATLRANVDLSRRIVAAAIPLIAAHVGPSPQHDALADAVITQPDAMDPRTRERLWLLIREALG
jgi:5'-methylthioadenosine phosphorylase